MATKWINVYLPILDNNIWELQFRMFYGKFRLNIVVHYTIFIFQISNAVYSPCLCCYKFKFRWKVNHLVRLVRNVCTLSYFAINLAKELACVKCVKCFQDACLKLFFVACIYVCMKPRIRSIFLFLRHTA